MDTDLLRTFLEIAEIKNFTKAASALGRTQAAISMQLSRLEQTLNAELFIRNNRHVSLTVFGEKLLPFARKILLEEKKMLSSFTPHPVQERIRIGAPEDIAFSYFPAILQSLATEHTEVALDVSCEFTEKLLQGLDAEEYDIILIKQDPLCPHPDSRAIWSEPLIWVAPENSSFITQISQPPIPLVLSHTPCVLRKQAVEALGNAHIEARIRFSSASLSANLAAVRAGLGITVLPKDLLTDDLREVPYLPRLQAAQIGLIKTKKKSELIDLIAELISDKMSENHDKKEEKKPLKSVS